MNVNTWFFTFITLVSVSTPVSAQELTLEKPCIPSFQKLADELKPAALAWKRPRQTLAAKKAQAAKVTDLSRLQRATRLISISDPNQSQALARLDDGIYVWGIDNKGNLAVLNRNMNPESLETTGSQFLGSHSGLMRVLQNGFGKDTQLLATGEIVRRNGRTMLVDNASGTYPGGAENLAYGYRQLVSRGLPVDERTVTRNRAVESATDPHDAAYLQVPIEIRVMRNPALRPAYQDTLRVMKKVDAKFSDRFSLYQALGRAVENGDIPKSVDAYRASYILERWLNTSEGTAYVFDAVYRDAKSAEDFQQTLRALEKIADLEKP